jgi:predicted nuclease of predicted toxin-antitoxin system
MSLKYLIDENVNPLYPNQIRQLEPDIVIKVVGEPETPPRSTLDPEILLWCEENNFVLVTNNRTSMPVHLADHIAQNRHVPGIFILNPNLSIGENLEELILAALASEKDDYQDQIVYLPLP